MEKSENKRIEYPIINGIYDHYKGGRYLVLFMAEDSETKEPMVVYKSLLFGSNHVRPLANFMEYADKNVRRFTYDGKE